MADKMASDNLTYIGHDENTAPKRIDGKDFISPATFIPLAQAGISVNSKTGNDAAKGK